MTNSKSGMSRHGLADIAPKSSQPRNRFPQEGSGSMTPSPSMLRVASVRMNKGMEIQNWARKIGRRLGNNLPKKQLSVAVARGSRQQHMLGLA